MQRLSLSLAMGPGSWWPIADSPVGRCCVKFPPHHKDPQARFLEAVTSQFALFWVQNHVANICFLFFSVFKPFNSSHCSVSWLEFPKRIMQVSICVLCFVFVFVKHLLPGPPSRDLESNFTGNFSSDFDKTVSDTLLINTVSISFFIQSILFYSLTTEF